MVATLLTLGLLFSIAALGIAANVRPTSTRGCALAFWLAMAAWSFGFAAAILLWRAGE